eukprot:IDg12109t1
MCIASGDAHEDERRGAHQIAAFTLDSNVASSLRPTCRHRALDKQVFEAGIAREGDGRTSLPTRHYGAFFTFLDCSMVAKSHLQSSSSSPGSEYSLCHKRLLSGAFVEVTVKQLVSRYCLYYYLSKSLYYRQYVGDSRALRSCETPVQYALAKRQSLLLQLERFVVPRCACKGKVDGAVIAAVQNTFQACGFRAAHTYEKSALRVAVPAKIAECAAASLLMLASRWAWKRSSSLLQLEREALRLRNGNV